MNAKTSMVRLWLTAMCATAALLCASTADAALTYITTTVTITNDCSYDDGIVITSTGHLIADQAECTIDGGIQIQSGGVLELKNSTSMWIGGTIFVYGTFIGDNATCNMGANWNIYVDGSLEAEDVVFTRWGGTYWSGITARNGGDIELTDCEVRLCRGCVKVLSTSTGTLLDIDGGVYDGGTGYDCFNVPVCAAGSHIAGASITAWGSGDGIDVSTSNLTIGATGGSLSNTITAVAATSPARYGIRVTGCSPLIQYCHIVGGTYGILLSNANSTVRHCNIHGGLIGGIACVGTSAPAIEYCWFWGSHDAHILVADTALPTIADATNAFHSYYDNGGVPVSGGADWPCTSIAAWATR